MFGRATIRLGIGPHSSVIIIYHHAAAKNISLVISDIMLFPLSHRPTALEA